MDIPLLPGVDTSTALRRLRGNVAQYRRFLESFVRKNSNAMTDLDALLQQGDRAAAHLYVHSLKGLAAAIGADALARAAQTLESALKNAATEPLQPLLDQIAIPLNALLQTILEDPTRPAPLAAGDTGTAPSGPAPSAPIQKNLPTLLVVDDVAENIEVLHNILEQHYRVKVATHGEKALGIVMSDQPPDLILLDIMMPGMDGYEVCRRIKANPARRGIPIIFVTSMEDQEGEALGLQLGAEDFITKPFNPHIVLARVKTHLALYDQTREIERKVDERTRALRDNEIGFHATRMSRYSQLIALAAHLPEGQAELIGRIVAIADVFDALSSSRPYKTAWPVERAQQTILDDAGRHFDPALVQAFARALPAILEVKNQCAEHAADIPLQHLQALEPAKPI